MAIPADAVPFDADYRLADFKLLLPIGPDIRVLVIAARERAFVGHLTTDIGVVDMVDASDRADPTSGQDGDKLRRIAKPDGYYDLIFSDDLDAVRHLGPSGTLCRFLAPDHESPRVVTDLTLIGRWRAYPDWPAFRVLIPDHQAGWRAAARDLRLYDRRSSTGLVARLSTRAASVSFPTRGIALYQRAGATARPSLLANLNDRFSGILTSTDQGPRSSPIDHWLLASGRLGPGNPILAFQLDAQGRPGHLIKVARRPGDRHLLDEAKQLREIAQALPSEVSNRIIQPLASTLVDGRAALIYRYEPTRPFYGMRWRLAARRRLCATMTEWLARIGQCTRRSLTCDRQAVRHLAPLGRLVARRILPPDIQARAEMAARALAHHPTGWPAVLEHGDLGLYNLRLSSADGSAFLVLDWGSSTFEGIPMGDLGYFLASTRVPATLARSCIKVYMAHMNLPVAAASSLWFSYLARRWEELDTIRPPVPTDPLSGGGLLLPIHRRVAAYLDTLRV